MAPFSRSELNSSRSNRPCPKSPLNLKLYLRRCVCTCYPVSLWRGVDLRALWTAVDRERRISMLSLSTPRIDADWAEVSIAICLSFSPTSSHRPAPKPSGPPWPPWPPIVIATATHMLPEITLWRGRRSHILLSTWVPEMGFLLSECELQAILLIHERYVTLFINSVTYRRRQLKWRWS